MREKYEETIISLSIIRSNLAASVNALHSGTLEEEGRAHKLNMFMWSEPGAAIKHITGELMCAHPPV